MADVEIPINSIVFYLNHLVISLQLVEEFHKRVEN
jgi:hypothetical protein